MMQRYNRKLLAGLLSLFFVLALFAGFQPAHANGAVSSLVETQWLADNLKNPDIRIIHLGSNEQGFNFKHIPGSVFVGIGDLMGAVGNGSAPPDKAKFEGLMSRLGVGNNTHAVIVGSASGPPFPVTVFWLMKYHGHEKVSFVNGGITKWIKENRVMTSDATKVSPAKYNSSPDGSVYATADFVVKNIKNPKTAIVDVRAADEYSGQNSLGMNKRVGHIPGVTNLEFRSTNLNADGTFKSVNDLKAAYEAKGVTGDKEVIIYCQGGIRAANTYFVLKHILGYPNVKNYVGSWGEWGNRLDPATYPVEK